MSDQSGLKYDVVVVGGGPFGSAAARHLAESGRRVAVVASPEPKMFKAPGATPMASHYDQGRIVHAGGSDPDYVALAAPSSARYPGLAKRTGIDFFRPRPLVMLAPDPEATLRHSLSVGADVRAIALDELRASFGIAPPPGFEGGAVIEEATAGFVNPRLLVRAQLKTATDAGADLHATAATSVDFGDAAQIGTADGRRIDADQLLLATGPYGTSLIDGGGADEQTHRPIQRRLRTIALIEIDGPTSEVPSLSAGGFLHPSADNPKLEETYWVPPVRYPDGGTYLKIGGNSLPMITASGDDDIGRWFAGGGSAEEADALLALAHDLLPERRLRLAAFKPCVVSYVPEERPIIERVHDRLVLALAGNGSGVNIGDEVGRRAADLVMTAA